MTEHTISVRQLNLYVKSLIEGDARLAVISVKGEISNFKNHFTSGHWYFTLKDNEASIRCVMFKWSAMKTKFLPEDGMEVVITGKVSLYEKDGQYQFYAEEMHVFGEGDLAAQFRQVKEKLEKEGLFSTDTKRKLPAFPEKIAVITSDTGAAVHDIINILKRRYPICKVVMCPVAVQGIYAAKEMVVMLERIYALEGIDLIIIGRGGGSSEDLAAFNDEALARKIYESPVPVISAVGHETDFTICDFVADVRAATPSAAAEISVPDIKDLEFKIFVLKNRLKSAVGFYYKRVDNFKQRIILSTNKIIDRKNSQFEFLVSKLDSLSPLKTLSRGYSVIQKGEAVVKSVNQIEKDDTLSLRLNDGRADCKVLDITERK